MAQNQLLTLTLGLATYLDHIYDLDQHNAWTLSLFLKHKFFTEVLLNEFKISSMFVDKIIN